MTSVGGAQTNPIATHEPPVSWQIRRDLAGFYVPAFPIEVEGCHEHQGLALGCVLAHTEAYLDQCSSSAGIGDLGRETPSKAEDLVLRLCPSPGFLTDSAQCLGRGLAFRSGLPPGQAVP